MERFVTNEIDLEFLISEDNGNASLSRFQFLIFTFVIAGSYFLWVMGAITKVTAADLLKDGKQIPLPDIPSGVLGLIGISGASYVVAKGIQKSADAGSSVVRVTVTNRSANYTGPPDVTFIGGGGTGARAIIGNAEVDHIDIAEHGSGYSAAPTVQITGGGGTGATAIAEIG